MLYYKKWFKKQCTLIPFIHVKPIVHPNYNTMDHVIVAFLNASSHPKSGNTRLSVKVAT